MPSPPSRSVIASRPRPRSRRSIAHMPTGTAFIDADKENATTELGSMKNSKTAQHTAKSLRKSRSKSIGPGGLDALTDDDMKPVESNVSYPKSILKPTIPLSPLRQIPSRTPTYPALDDEGNIIMQSRHPLLDGRTSLFDIPKISNNATPSPAESGTINDEKQLSARREREEKEERERQKKEIQERRDARRKSLANRRVSFAPEATLHTWDVIEYAQDSTTSSAASNNTRRASSASSASEELTSRSMNAPPESPSTPPKKTGGKARMRSPMQRQSPHQKKRRRRSSTIPPMNFNNPDEFDDISSSPSSVGSDVHEQTQSHTSQPQSPMNEASESDEELDDDQGTASMVLDTVYLPGQSSAHASLQQQHAELNEALEKSQWKLDAASTPTEEIEDDGEMTMEIVADEVTSAFQPWAQRPSTSGPNGGKLVDAQPVYPNLRQGMPSDPRESEVAEDSSEEEADMSMELTRGVGKIVPFTGSADDERGQLEQATKIPPSKTAFEFADRDSSPDDMAMELTMPLGKISGPTGQASVSFDDDEGDENEELTMEFTSAIGGLLGSNCRKESTPEPITPQSERKIEASPFPSNDGTVEETNKATEPMVDAFEGSNEMDMDMEMEMTQAMGGILAKATEIAGPERPTEGKTNKSAATEAIPDIQDHDAKDIVAPKEPTLNIREMIESLTPKKKARGRKSLHTGTARGLLGKRPIELDEDSEDGTPSKFRKGKIDLFSHTDRVAKSPSMGGETPKKTNLSVPTLPPKSPTLVRETPKKSSTPNAKKGVLSETGKEYKSVSPVKIASPVKPKLATPRKSGPRTRSAHAARSEPLKSPVKGVAPERKKDNMQLQNFLNLTSIRFMELTTTKRRDTTFARNNATAKNGGNNGNGSMASYSFDDHVTAGACTIPMLRVFQKSCHELKNKLSDGRNTIHYIETRSSEDNPQLFQEYISAPLDIKSIMDNQFKNMKTYARLQSKRTWYDWRMSLLKPVKSELGSTLENLKADEEILASEEKLLEPVLPKLFEKHSRLEDEEQELRKRAEELANCDLEQLSKVRDKLVDTQSDLEAQTRLLAELQKQMRETEDSQADLLDQKAKILEDISHAEKTSNECRGYESAEIMSLEADVRALEQKHGWSIKSATPTGVSIIFHHGLELTLASLPPKAIFNPSKASINLSLCTDILEPVLQSAQSQTVLQFFLGAAESQFSHFLSARDPPTSTGHGPANLGKLLAELRRFWDTACDVTRRLHSLALSFVTDIQPIPSSGPGNASIGNSSSGTTPTEVLEVKSMVLLPALRSKVLVRFAIAVSGGKVSIDPSASIIYGNGVKPHPDRLTAYLNRKIGGVVGDWKDKSGVNGKKSLGGHAGSSRGPATDKDLWRRTIQEFQGLLIMGKAVA